MTTTTADVRNRLALALDFSDLETATGIARDLGEWFGVAKVGLELWSAAGSRAIAELRDLGFEVFADLKLHDIPTTVGRAARVLGGQGVRYLNFHAAGGVEMLRAGVEGLADGARDAGLDAPIAIGVTVLTSDRDVSGFDARLEAAIASGCRGVVCSVQEIERVHRAAPEFVTIVPGVRFAGDDAHDQARVGTPDAVARAGGNVLVVGRAVTAAPDARAVARRISEAVLTASPAT